VSPRNQTAKRTGLREPNGNEKENNSAFKAQIVRDVLREDTTMSQFATEHSLHPNHITRWRDQALAALSDVCAHEAAQTLAAKDCHATLKLSSLNERIGLFLLSLGPGSSKRFRCRTRWQDARHGRDTPLRRDRSTTPCHMGKRRQHTICPFFKESLPTPLIVCEPPPGVRVVPTEDNRPAIGIDVGLKSFLTDSNGATVANPRFFRTSQRTLRRKQRTLSRRKKGSNRRKKTARSVAQTHLKISRQRTDFHFKVAHQYVMLYSMIVVEHLNIAGMVKNRHLSKSILDAAWASFLNILQYKAERAGSEVVRINPKYTTQRCSRCGERTPKSLSVRIHVCQHCSFVLDRDQNAALNILRAGAPPCPKGHPDDWQESVG